MTIVAPAGYGKTSLAAQWHDNLLASGQQGVWVGLDSEHRNQSQFILVLLEAFDRLMPADRMARDTANLSSAALLGILATRLRRFTTPLILFLDDYHFAQTDATESVVARLLADSTLEHLKFVLISRSAPRFPISSLRLKNELKQVGVGELAFSDMEAEEFFAGNPAGLTADQIGSLNQRTEGWAVALQMVRVLVSDNIEADAIISYLDAGTAEMGSYLSEQVFANLPAPVRRFLIETAALPALNRELVAAISDEVSVSAVFQDLAGFGLPIATLGGQGNWIRYHPVFNTFLKEEAERQYVDTCGTLQRAARWFEQQGDCDTAVRHALLSGDANLAARIVEDAGGWRRVYATTRGGTTMFQAIIDKAAEIDLSRFPLTTLGLSVVSAKAGQLDAADHYLAIAEHGTAQGNEALAGDLRVVRVLLSLYTDRTASNADLSALEDDLLKHEGMELIHRALALNMLCYNALIRGELERALHYGHLAIHAFRGGKADFGAMHLYTHVGQAAYFSGDCAKAAEAYNQLITEAQCNIGKGSDLDAVGQVLKAELLSMNGHEDTAEAILDWALPHLERHDTWFDLLAAGFLAQQRVLLLKGDQVAAHASVDRVHAAARRRGFDRLTWLVEGERARLLLAFGDTEQAIRYAEAKGMGRKSAGLDRANDLAIHPRGTVPALLWARIHLALGDFVGARGCLSQLIVRQVRKPNVPRAIELALLEICLMIAEGRQGEAATRLGDLVLGTSLGDYRAILRVEGDGFLSALRTLASDESAPEIVGRRLAQSLGEDWPSRVGRKDIAEVRQADGGLTDRERSVMELLSVGLSNKEISRKLDMSDNTVKFHLRNIYAKLNVGTRLAAVNAARNRGVLAGG
ncbi:LuxR C-terminal-related transcriptional regulator [Rhizobium leguminosarum]|uniref:LuxR C-terminal-related transcriptional regulator n=1 Tax=Rhizobium leguminosarum TaxID=384 RepID=UPI003D0191EF